MERVTGTYWLDFKSNSPPKSCALKTEPSLHSVVLLLVSYACSLFSAVLSEMATAKCERTGNSDTNKLWSGNSFTPIRCCMFYYWNKERGQQSIITCRIWLFVISVVHTFAGDEVCYVIFVVRRHFIDYNKFFVIHPVSIQLIYWIK